MVRPTRSRLKRVFRTMSGPRCTMRITEWPWFAPSWPFICRHAPIGRLQMNPRARSGWGWAENGEPCGGLACRVVRTRPCIERSVRETGHLGTRARDEGTAILFWGRHLSVRAIVANGRVIVPAPLSVSVGVSLGVYLPWGWLLDLGIRCQVVVRVACSA